MNKQHIIIGITALLMQIIFFCHAVPYISIRSQGFNAARDIIGIETLINRFDSDCFYGCFTITPEYTRSFRAHDTARALFDGAIDQSNCFNDISSAASNEFAIFRVQGSQLDGRATNSLMADNFYLPTNFSSIVTVTPKIENVIIDFGLYFGLDEWAPGLYFTLHAPICHTMWDMQYCEAIINEGTNNYDPGYFNDTLNGKSPNQYGLNHSLMLKSFREYIVDGLAIQSIPSILCNSLDHARINTCKPVVNRPAELTATLGWNLICDQDYILGLSIRGAAPTGNRPEGIYLFEPIVGNGHHWELGMGVNAQYILWESIDHHDFMGAYMAANVTHLFKTRQCRTFDLINRPLSRYMLAMKYTSNVQNLAAGSTTINTSMPEAQFAKEYMPVANLTTIPVDVSSAIHGDMALTILYAYGNFQMEIGYNLWGRTCENIYKRGDCCDNTFSENTWALKGDAFVFGFEKNETNELIGIGIPLSATQNNATICKGTNNWPDGLADTAWYQNPGINNPQNAWNVESGTASALYTSQQANIPLQVLTSLQPSFITEGDIDINAARTSGLSNKVYANFGYVWHEREIWIPFINIGAEVEFGHQKGICGKPLCENNQTTKTNNQHGCTYTNNTCCQSFAISQWGVWFKGGFAFE